MVATLNAFLTVGFSLLGQAHDEFGKLIHRGYHYHCGNFARLDLPVDDFDGALNASLPVLHGYFKHRTKGRLPPCPQVQSLPREE